MCPEVSYLATDEFYSNTLHVLTMIEIPVHLFGGYIVLTKTPRKMSSVKKSMFCLHVMGAIFDIYLSSLTIPVVTIPLCAGYPLGLFLLLGVPTKVQVYFAFCLASMVSVGILAFFEDRYYVLGNGVNQKRNWKRNMYIGSLYTLSFFFVLPGFLSIPDQIFGRKIIHEKIVCLPSDIPNRPGFFILTIDSTIMLFCFSSMATFITIQTLFFAVSIAYNLTSSVSKCKSKNILKLHKQFMVALCVQVSVPLVVMCVPVAFVALSIWNGYYNQAATNICIIIVATHGVASTVTMLSVHRPYREVTMEILKVSFVKETKKEQKIWNV